MKRLILFLLLTVCTTDTLFAQQKSPSTQKKKVSVKYDEEKALSCVYDYYAFYNADYTFRNAEVRRVSNNVLYISLQECTNKRSLEKMIFFGGLKF
jgi:hypothetical protein